MAVQFKYVEYKNFLATGENPIRIDLNRSPTTLISGKNGHGKCVRGSTSITVRQLICGEYITKDNTTVKEVVDYYKNNPRLIGSLDVITRHGFRTIEYADVTAIDSIVYRIQTVNDKVLYCSPTHRIISNDQWWHVEDLVVGDEILTANGYEAVESISIEPEREDLYDLQVADVKEYYTNGIVSHNSSMQEAVTYSLFGKPYRDIKKGQLVNSINKKHCLVTIEFDANGKSYKIIRGIKPVKFEIYENGVMLNQDASSRDYQKHLEKNILKMNYRSFCQTVVLGNANFTPFMQLPTWQRREIVEELLDIKVFSTMNTLLKERISSNKELISQNQVAISTLNEKVRLQEEYIGKLHALNNEERDSTDKKIADVQAEAAKIIDQIEELQSQEFSPSLKSDLEELTAQLDEITSSISGHKVTLSNVKKDIEYLSNNDNCHACHQDIPLDFKEDKIESLRLSGVEELSVIEEQEASKKAAKTKITEIKKLLEDQRTRDNEVSRLIAILQVHKKSITTLSQNIEKKSQDDSDIISAQSELLSLIEERESALITKFELNQRKQYNDAMYEMLKDTGIKTKIIKQYLPVMNTLINHYLGILDFFVSFNIDENFNETIKSRYRDEFSYSSFSEGEKSRIDIALLMTWREISRRKNSSATNLLILDEVFDGALDGEGTDNLMKILDTLEAGTNVFVISHKVDMLESKLRSHIIFEKEGNFSKISIDKV